MSEFDEELRKLAKTRPADVSAIGVARLVKHIEEQEARAEAAEARVREMEASTRWIPFTEKLPEEGQKVIALSKRGFVVDFCFIQKWNIGCRTGCHYQSRRRRRDERLRKRSYP